MLDIVQCLSKMHVFSNEVTHKGLANLVFRFYTELNLKAAAAAAAVQFLQLRTILPQC